MMLASARTQLADFLSTLIYVYTLLIILYIVIQLLFAVGLRPPYSRADRRRARLPARHLRTVPAHLPPRDPALRGIDFSPILAIITLQIINSIVVRGLIHG